MYSKILVPVDGSATATRGLDEAISLAKLCGGRIRLLYVIDTLSVALSIGAAYALADDMLAALRDVGQHLLADAQARADAQGVATESHQRDGWSGRVADAVIDDARDWGAELIVLGTHGRRGIDRALMGSDAEEIVRRAPIPVLLVRSDAAAPKA